MTSFNQFGEENAIATIKTNEKNTKTVLQNKLEKKSGAIFFLTSIQFFFLSRLNDDFNGNV